ncbi:hypothetical protein [Sphingosinicella humi]|uniref:Circumsporozoite protein n=1 Tax=Allosphingosinicella humi TaxID=2068657 RepID=A0A2U2J4H8_9SPHN|nr:hypothetical protein [Sphingosinicella humi]PWG03259.1 hypothetical protein DF286_10565 [Sphingosinicella humi]
MRDLLKTVMTSSMVAGAALLVVACDSGADTEVNNMTVDMGTTDTMMDGTTNDVTAVDGAMGEDANMAMDANMTMDANMMDANMTTDMNATDANMTNGM